VNSREEQLDMDILFVAGFAPIATDTEESLSLYRDSLGLPLEGEGEYKSTFELGGVKHFGVWPLSQAAQSCFGQTSWPVKFPVPQATIEFEMRSAQAVEEGIKELIDKGYEAIHEAREEPWGQKVARIMGPEGLLVGLSYAPWLHDDYDETENS
jgi:catechol 2,3-dioxygenase-like lactoylglutathione lyase family enzyme